MMNKTKSPRWYGLKNSMILISIATVVTLTSTFETKVIAQDPYNASLVIINGKKSDHKTLQALNPENIQAIEVLKDSKAVSKYGKDGQSGVIEVTLKDTLVSHSSGNMEKVKVVGYGGGAKKTTEDVKVVGYRSQKTSSDTVVGHGPFVLKDPITFPGNYNENKKPLVFLDDKKMGCVSADEINSYKAHKVMIIEGPEATKKYGDEAKDGVMLLYTKPDSEIPGGIVIREVHNNGIPLYVINGKPEPNLDLKTINPEEIEKIEILKGPVAIEKYGNAAKYGVVLVTLKGVMNAQPNNTNNSLILVPNPASDNVDITLKGTKTSGMFDVKIFDKYGKLLVQDKKSGPTFTVSVAGLPAGVYVVAVTDGDTKYTGNLSVIH